MSGTSSEASKIGKPSDEPAKPPVEPSKPVPTPPAKKTPARAAKRAAGAAALGGGIGSGISFDKGVAESSGPTGPGVGPALRIGQVSGNALNLKLPEGMPGDPQAPVNNMGEAMDRLTREFILMMEERKVLVIWLFDESESMKKDQKTVHDKIDRVYRELGLIKSSYSDALSTAVASYGD